MAQIKLKMLIEKLNAPRMKYLQAEKSYCLDCGHYNIELGHWFFMFFQSDNEAWLLTLLKYGLNQIGANLSPALQNLDDEKLKIIYERIDKHSAEIMKSKQANADYEFCLKTKVLGDELRSI